MNNSRSSSHKSRTWLITGGSSGIGLSLLRAAAARGDKVMAVSRNTDGLASVVDEFDGRVQTATADVTDEAAVRRAVDATVESFGRIDVVANNAGIGVAGGVEEASGEQAKAIFDTNVLGVLNVLRAVLPVLREQRSGHILQQSSFLGQVSGPGQGLTAATKFAVEGLSDSLAAEVAPLGIKVTIIEPGLTATKFFANMSFATSIDDYDQTVGAARRQIGSLPPEVFSDPDRVATAILAAVDADEPPVRLPTGSFSIAKMREGLDARQGQLDVVATLSQSVDGQAGA
jgi:NAD(P)-dependent dehydrogenase (short-subunit alcohol dehydrogenase family)